MQNMRIANLELLYHDDIMHDYSSQAKISNTKFLFQLLKNSRAKTEMKQLK